MALSGYGRTAERHWRTFLPTAYANLENPEEFFEELDERVMALVDEMQANLLAGQTLSTETGEREKQLSAARRQAEETVLAEEVFLPAEPGQEANELPAE